MKDIFSSKEDIEKNAYMNWRTQRYDHTHNMNVIGVGANAATSHAIANPDSYYTSIKEVQQLELELVNDLRALPADASIDKEIDSLGAKLNA